MGRRCTRCHFIERSTTRHRNPCCNVACVSAPLSAELEPASANADTLRDRKDEFQDRTSIVFARNRSRDATCDRVNNHFEITTCGGTVFRCRARSGACEFATQMQRIAAAMFGRVALRCSIPRRGRVAALRHQARGDGRLESRDAPHVRASLDDLTIGALRSAATDHEPPREPARTPSHRETRRSIRGEERWLR